MFKILSFVIISFLNLTSNNSYQNKTTLMNYGTIKENLEKIAVENLRSWEPPFNEEKMLEPFTQENDFLVVIDGFTIKDYNRWAKVVYESMRADRESNFRKYKHIIRDIHTSVLSNNSAVVTVIYTWDYITKESKHYNTDAAVTLVFELKENDWKIIQFHCSHGNERLVTETFE